MKCKNLHAFVGILLSILSFQAFALQERHLILVRQGGAMALSEEGQQRIQQTADILLTHGFDNRSIVAVYVAPDKGSQHCAMMLVERGLITQDKISKESRLGKDHTEHTLMAFYDAVEKEHPKGHIIFIDDNTGSLSIIENVTKSKPDSRSTQAYILPLSTRHA